MENVKSVTIQYLPNIEEQDASKQLIAGKFLFPGFAHEFAVVAKSQPGGKVRYVTGLEEGEIPEDKLEEVKQAKDELEQFYGVGVLDAKNEAFWREIKLVLNKKTTFLDIKSNPEHKLFYYIIKGGGIPEISPSYDEAISSSKPTRWFLTEPNQLADLTSIDERLIDRATARLVDLDTEKTLDDLLLVHKNLISSDRGITRQTPRATIYKDLSNFIKGKIVKTDKKRTPAQFLEAIELLKKDKKKLFITAYVRDAIYFNYISTNSDGQFVNSETKAKYGTTPQAVVSKLSNPAFQDELENIKLKIEKKWAE